MAEQIEISEDEFAKVDAEANTISFVDIHGQEFIIIGQVVLRKQVKQKDVDIA